jgi:hypothetical protein
MQNPQQSDSQIHCGSADSTVSEESADTLQVSATSESHPPAAGADILALHSSTTTSLQALLDHSDQTALINVFQFPFLTTTECETMTKIILDNRYRFPHESSMQKHTVDATSVLGDVLYTRVVKDLIPTINLLFDFGQLQSYYVFSAHAIIYSASGSGEKKLSIHVDDADITVNITLHSSELSGSELAFRGTTEYGNDFCAANLEKLRLKIEGAGAVTQVKQTVGNCILHRGSHPHCVTDISAGERVALILWLKKKHDC